MAVNLETLESNIRVTTEDLNSKRDEINVLMKSLNSARKERNMLVSLLERLQKALVAAEKDQDERNPKMYVGMKFTYDGERRMVVEPGVGSRRSAEATLAVIDEDGKCRGACTSTTRLWDYACAGEQNKLGWPGEKN